MRRLSSFALAASFLVAPPLVTASFAQSSGGGSDVPPATARAAVAGPVTHGSVGTSNNLSTRPMNGVAAGGGMATASGMKAGGNNRSAVKKGGKSVIAAP